MFARRALAVALAPYVLWLIFAYRYHFLDGVNLAFHEAGHLFFGIFGTTLHFLGGTLGQFVFPVAATLHFAARRERFEAAVCVLWGCESAMYAAAYVADAHVQRLPLVGGHIHDWNWLLSRWGALGAAEEIGWALHALASLGAAAAWTVCAREALRRAETGPGPVAAAGPGTDGPPQAQGAGR